MTVNYLVTMVMCGPQSEEEYMCMKGLKYYCTIIEFEHKEIIKTPDLSKSLLSFFYIFFHLLE